MKLLTRAFATALLSAAMLAATPDARAQNPAHIDINVSPPAWGPPVPPGTQYYYIPEIDGYYDLNAEQYLVYRNGQWIPVGVIEGSDPRNFRPVVLDYRGREPWVYVGAHRDRYPRRVVVQPRPVPARQRNLPPGQVKKLYREGRDNGRGNGNSRGPGRD